MRCTDEYPSPSERRGFTPQAREADLHLAILPGTDVALFNGLLHLCLWDDRIATDYIAAHTEGWPELKRLVRGYTPRFVAATCGIGEDDLATAARWFGEARAALSVYCQGLNQSSAGTAKNAALINLHLATGQIGRPGTGPFSLTGQPNAMGGREVGGMANLLSAHRDLNNPAHRAEVAALWGIERVPEKLGKTAVELFNAIAEGSIKAVWIACTNPAQSMPEQKRVHDALAKAELVVVQDAFANIATARHADVLLLAATWGEKGGTVTNSERRISRARRAAEIEAALGIDDRANIDAARIDAHLLKYEDTRRGHARRVLVRDGALAAVSLSGDWSAEVWLKDYLETAMPVASLGRLLLQPGSIAPAGFKSRGRVVCNCLNVGESEIASALVSFEVRGEAGGECDDAARLAALQRRLRCGTECGSCLPELKRMVHASRGTVSA